MVEKNADSAPANLIITLSPRRSYLTKLAQQKTGTGGNSIGRCDYFARQSTLRSELDGKWLKGRLFTANVGVPWRAPIRQGAPPAKP